MRTGLLPMLILAACWAGEALGAEGAGRDASGPWPPQKAWEWHRRQPWLVGCNFLPSTAINDVEMWQAESFDPATIDRELGWAEALGLNSVRVFLNYVVWQHEPDGLKRRLGRVLEIAARHGISVMPVLFDDCAFAGREPAIGPQGEPVPGVHNSGWVPSPGLKRVADRAAWPDLERYVEDLVGAFARDPRVVLWDLYNEPGNSGMGEKSLPLVEAAFAWARGAQPTQPLTVGAWADFASPMQRRMMELSDVVSFHGYDPPRGLLAKVAACQRLGRPVVCTEWLRRGSGNTFRALLPAFRERKIGCYHWGLVAGRTQTYFPWGSPKGAPMPAVWQHDVLHADGRPFRPGEARFLRTITGKLPPPAVLAPTAEKQPVAWRYTLERPAADWFLPDFDDAGWKRADAPFGRAEKPFRRAPRTEWTTAAIWLRRPFDLPEGDLGTLALVMHHDEDAEVYLNGVLAARASGYNAAYEEFEVSPAARAALRPGRNTLAVHCRQTTGGQYLDVGLLGWRGE